jgi:hypothetical protein
MDDQTNPDLDQTDEDILAYTVSDEALGAAAGTEPRKQTVGFCSAIVVCNTRINCP